MPIAKISCNPRDRGFQGCHETISHALQRASMVGGWSRPQFGFQISIDPLIWIQLWRVWWQMLRIKVTGSGKKVGESVHRRRRLRCPTSRRRRPPWNSNGRYWCSSKEAQLASLWSSAPSGAVSMAIHRQTSASAWLKAGHWCRACSIKWPKGRSTPTTPGVVAARTAAGIAASRTGGAARF